VNLAPVAADGSFAEQRIVGRASPLGRTGEHAAERGSEHSCAKNCRLQKKRRASRPLEITYNL
jgi:hypothetical protein